MQMAPLLVLRPHSTLCGEALLVDRPACRSEKSIPLSPLNVSIHVGTNASRRRKDRVS